MKPYKHFTPYERFCLEDLIKKGEKIKEIARILNRDRSSIYREIRRNTEKNGEYKAISAYDRYRIRRKKSIRRRRIQKDSKLYKYIHRKLKRYWSPETIAEKWNRKTKDEDRISFTTIYHAVYRGEIRGISAKTHLRRRGKPVTGDRSKFNTIHPDHFIHERPEVIERRERFGDWEGDTLRGTPGKGGLITLVDRKSRYLIAILIHGFSSQLINDKIIEALKDMNPKSITLDNGSEFAKFRTFEKELNTIVYFADPHSPWQRGTNENTNDMLRFWFPKNFDFKSVTQAQIDYVVDIINSRPRACLNFSSPKQIFCCT